MLEEFFKDKANYLFKKSHSNDPYFDPTVAYTYVNSNAQIKTLHKESSQPSIHVEPELNGIVTLAVENAAIDEKEAHNEIRNKTAFVEKFKHIGFIDPFPEKQAANLPKPSIKQVKLNTDIYPAFKMDNPDQPPTMIYIPSAEIMVKMIKACIGVKSGYDILEKF